jgi:hypothetical protein
LDRLEKLQRAQDADALLKHPLLVEAFDALEAVAMSSIRSSDPGGLTATAACATLKVIHDIKEHLKGVVNDDKVAEQLEKRKQYRPF